MDKELIDYFMHQTNKRFDKLEKKIDYALRICYTIIGGLSALNIIILLIMGG